MSLKQVFCALHLVWKLNQQVFAIWTDLSSQFENNHFTGMSSGCEAGTYLSLIDFVYHSTLGMRVIKKKRGMDLSISAVRKLYPNRVLT